MLVGFIGLLSSCKAISIPEEKRTYVGTWEGVGFHLTITHDGGVDYRRVNGNYTKTVTGPVKSFEGDIITSKQDIAPIINESKFNKELLIPKDTKPGTYVAYAKVTYEGTVGVSSDIFDVIAKPSISAPAIIKKAIENYPFYFFLGILIIILILTIFFRYITITHKKDIQKIEKEIKDTLQTRK